LISKIIASKINFAANYINYCIYFYNISPDAIIESFVFSHDS